jgi:hypothetical protein
MSRWIVAASLVLAAAPTQAAVRFDSGFATFGTGNGDYEEFAPGLGATGRSYGISDIGGCEGADETGERCGAFEGSGFGLTLGDASFVYTADLSQNHATASANLQTDIFAQAYFRADRQMVFRVDEVRGYETSLCGGGCSHGFSANFFQNQEIDGSWLAYVDVSTAAATREGIQRLGHQFSASLTEVPEPDSWALLIAGFGLVGAAQRRRRSTSRA